MPTIGSIVYGSRCSSTTGSRSQPKRMSGEKDRRDDQAKNTSALTPATRLTAAMTAADAHAPPATAVLTATPVWLSARMRPDSPITIAANWSGLSFVGCVGRV